MIEPVDHLQEVRPRSAATLLVAILVLPFAILFAGGTIAAIESIFRASPGPSDAGRLVALAFLMLGTLFLWTMLLRLVRTWITQRPERLLSWVSASVVLALFLAGGVAALTHALWHGSLQNLTRALITLSFGIPLVVPTLRLRRSQRAR
ncbi:MAG TPA: hypothetical protein VGI39_34630 [Polyangiaceae bacterium]|jgi:hypothetical protein